MGLGLLFQHHSRTSSLAVSNGMPIVLPQEQVDLFEDAEKGANARVEVNLEDQTIASSDGDVIKFDIDPFPNTAY